VVDWLRFFRRGATVSKDVLKHPDWYPEWRHEAVHQLRDKNADLEAQFQLGTWPRYDYDVDAGTLTFSEHGVVRLVAEIQIAGTTSTKARNWLWAWANSHWPAERVTSSQLVKAFGEEHGICELTHEYANDDEINHLGWELTSVMVRITGALGAYRPPGETGALFLVIKTIAWAS
jgi:hypothetical protein